MNVILIIGIGVILVALLGIILKYRKDFFKILKAIGTKIKGIKIQFVSIPVAIVVMAILFILTPDKYYYFVFIFVFTFGLHYIISRLMDYVYVISLDWENNKMQVVELSTRALNHYKIVDEDDQLGYIKMWIKCKSGRIALVDSIDTKQKIIIVNPIVSNFDFMKNYKQVDMTLKKTINKLTNELAKLQGEMEYKTVKKAKEILENSSLLSTIVGESNDNTKKEVKAEKEPTENKEGETSG